MLIDIEHVRYRYPVSEGWGLDDASLQVEAGEYVVLAGASGSGKSTLLRLLNGLIPHFYGGELQGRVRIDGTDTVDRPVHAWLPFTGLVFQNPKAQLFASSVEREVAYGLESLGLARDEIRARLDWAAEVAQIGPLLGRAPHLLSGGEQQRVVVAAMLALRPRVLALDEPFTNLDPEAAYQLRSIMRDIQREGTTLIVAEHKLSEMLADATRLVVVAGGRIALDGSPRDILRQDLAPYRINLPTFARFARACGLSGSPLTLDEAVQMGVHAQADQVAQPVNGEGSGSRPVIEAEGLGHDLAGRPVLRDINLRVLSGDTVALVGRNGSGKTTLLKHLNGLRRPARGRLSVLGHDMRKARMADLAAQVGYVFQNPNDQLFKLTVREEIEVGARATRRFDSRLLDALYDNFDLRSLLDCSPFRLSEGQKKRVAFASALAVHPELLVLDEPTVGQDAASHDALVRWLRESHQTTIIATHDLEFAQEVAPRWIALAGGETVADGAPACLMSDARVMSIAGLRPTARFQLAAQTGHLTGAEAG
ncbi:MAG: ATP-binding cassette domain-containing protein [Chloroflexi bacterium]|nr:ATP-binding cassette domain-containing protein [Chloroflexota bacterium]MCL5274508.1 ATP-binding cassette domain-containing protein [Chloroflexota bacterium]